MHSTFAVGRTEFEDSKKRIRGEFKISTIAKRDRSVLPVGRARAKDYHSPLTCSPSRCPRRRGGCRSLRGGDGDDGDGDCCPRNWNWPSHRSYSRPAPGPEDGPSPEKDTWSSRSTVFSQKFNSIAARRVAFL